MLLCRKVCVRGELVLWGGSIWAALTSGRTASKTFIFSNSQFLHLYNVVQSWSPHWKNCQGRYRLRTVLKALERVWQLLYFYYYLCSTNKLVDLRETWHIWKTKCKDEVQKDKMTVSQCPQTQNWGGRGRKTASKIPPLVQTHQQSLEFLRFHFSLQDECFRL